MASELEITNKLFLELSQFVTARTQKELLLERQHEQLKAAVILFFDIDPAEQVAEWCTASAELRRLAGRKDD